MDVIPEEKPTPTAPTESRTAEGGPLSPIAEGSNEDAESDTLLSLAHWFASGDPAEQEILENTYEALDAPLEDVDFPLDENQPTPPGL